MELGHFGSAPDHDAHWDSRSYEVPTMKHAFSREVRFAGHRNAGFAAASRRLTVGRPFKTGTLVPPPGTRAASRRLNLAPRLGCHLIRRSATGWEIGLPRPALKGRPTLRCRYAAMKMSKLRQPLEFQRLDHSKIPAPFQGLGDGYLISVVQITADRDPHGYAGHFNFQRLDKLGEIKSRRFSFHIGIRR